MNIYKWIAIGGLFAFSVSALLTASRLEPLGRLRAAEAKSANLAHDEAIAKRVLASLEKDKAEALAKKVGDLAAVEKGLGLRVIGVREGARRGQRRTVTLWVSGSSGTVMRLLEALRAGLAWQKVTAVAAQAKEGTLQCNVIVEDKL